MDFSKLFPNLKKTTEKDLKDKEKSLSVGDHVCVVKNIRCKQAGKSGVITKINPEDKHGWKSFVVKFDDSKYGSMAFQSGNLNKTVKTAGYEPPYTLDQIREELGDEVADKLSKDPVHRWRSDTGIELIHKEPDLEEFKRIVRNWKLMDDAMKAKSDKKSKELFGKGNMERVEELLDTYRRREKARRFVSAVRKMALKRKLNMFLVTDGASGVVNNGNTAVRNAREAQIQWELEHGDDPYEDWSKKAEVASASTARTSSPLQARTDLYRYMFKALLGDKYNEDDATYWAEADMANAQLQRYKELVLNRAISNRTRFIPGLNYTIIPHYTSKGYWPSAVTDFGRVTDTYPISEDNATTGRGGMVPKLRSKGGRSSWAGWDRSSIGTNKALQPILQLHEGVHSFTPVKAVGNDDISRTSFWGAGGIKAKPNSGGYTGYGSGQWERLVAIATEKAKLRARGFTDTRGLGKTWVDEMLRIRDAPYADKAKAGVGLEDYMMNTGSLRSILYELHDMATSPTATHEDKKKYEDFINAINRDFDVAKNTNDIRTKNHNKEKIAEDNQYEDLIKKAELDLSKWPKYDDFQKERHDKAVELARKIIEEHYKKMHQWGAKTEKGFLSKGKVNNSNRDDVIIRGGKNILKQHRGTCHELSNARLKLLRDAGIDAHRVFNFYGVGQDNDGLLGHSMVIFRGDDGKLHFASPHMADKKRRTGFGNFDSLEDAVNQYMTVMKDKNMGGEFSDDDFVEIHDTTDMDIPDKIKFRDFLHKALKGKLLYTQGR